MLCVSVVGPGYQRCVDVVSRSLIAEVRIDKARLSLDEVIRLFDRYGWKLIATCRQEGISEEDRLEYLLSAVEAGAWMVDIELEVPKKTRELVLAGAKSAGCKVIVSHHDFEKTPTAVKLDGIVKRCFQAGGDVAKIACMVNEPRDNARLLGLLDSDKPVIAIGMGERGKVTRVASLFSGAPFTYVSQGKEKKAAPGQMDLKEVSFILRKLRPSGSDDKK